MYILYIYIFFNTQFMQVNKHLYSFVVTVLWPFSPVVMAAFTCNYTSEKQDINFKDNNLLLRASNSNKKNNVHFTNV